ncbi:GNAT family N-acetyltransferase [Kaarinaea lacus]
MEIDQDLQLGLLQRHHADELFSRIDSNRNYLREWLPWVDLTKDVTVVTKFIASTLEQFSDGFGFQAGIFLAEQLIGVTGYKPIDATNCVGEIGYWLAQDHQGRGIMTKCVSKVIAGGFKEYGLNKIVISSAMENHRSRAVAQRLGFSEEGIQRQREWLNGRFVDHMVYTLLKDEYGNI